MKRNQSIAITRKQGSELRRMLILIVIAISIVLTFRGISVVGKTIEQPQVSNEKYYTSIDIAEGDTLWSIAAEHMSDGFQDEQTYINEIIRLNHLSSEEIHAGESLIIPYYEVRGL
jgi:LysM repeat protein